MNFKANITKALYKLNVKSPDQSNVGGYLADVYLWETIEKLAKGKAEDAWRSLVREHIIPADDTLRENVIGRFISTKTDHFIVEVEIKNPRSLFDKEEFIKKVSAEFKIPKHKLDELAATTISHTRAPLTKRVLEV